MTSTKESRRWGAIPKWRLISGDFTVNLSDPDVTLLLVWVKKMAAVSYGGKSHARQTRT